MPFPNYVNQCELIEFPIVNKDLQKYYSMNFFVACEASRGYNLLADDKKEK